MANWFTKLFTRSDVSHRKPDEHGPEVPVAPPTAPYPPAMDVDLDTAQEGRLEREREERDE